MSLFVFGSLHGSPGVTTAALAVAGCLDQGVLVEADLDGGVLAARHKLQREPGLGSFVADPAGGDDLMAHCQRVGDVPVMVGSEDPAVAEPVWSRAGSVIAKRLSSTDVDVVVDAGRLRASAALGPLLAGADAVVVLVRPMVEELVCLARQISHLRASSGDVVAVRAGAGQYSAKDISEQVVLEVVGDLPHDPHSASVLAGNDRWGRGFSNTAQLPSAARNLASALVARADTRLSGVAEVLS